MIEFKLGHKDLARRDLSRALALNPHFQPIQDARRGADAGDAGRRRAMTSRFAAFSVRRHAWRMALLIVAIGTMAPRPAAAHPMGNFSINHYAAIGVAPSLIELRYLIDMAEIPTFQEMHEHGFAADPADPRVASYLNKKCRSAARRPDTYAQWASGFRCAKLVTTRSSRPARAVCRR